MERFAIKIDRKLKANLYKICRLCGMDYPEMVPILSESMQTNETDINLDCEPEMPQKIHQLIGLTVGGDKRQKQKRARRKRYEHGLLNTCFLFTHYRSQRTIRCRRQCAAYALTK